MTDLVCFKEMEDTITIRLVHCKYSSSNSTGSRLLNVEVLASKIARSARCLGAVEALEKQLRVRDIARMKKEFGTRFMAGDIRLLKGLVQRTRQKKVVKEVIAVQPGLSRDAATQNVGRVLAAAARYVTDTTEAETFIWCSR